MVIMNNNESMGKRITHWHRATLSVFAVVAATSGLNWHGGSAPGGLTGQPHHAAGRRASCRVRGAATGLPVRGSRPLVKPSTAASASQYAAFPMAGPQAIALHSRRRSKSVSKLWVGDRTARCGRSRPGFARRTRQCRAWRPHRLPPADPRTDRAQWLFGHAARVDAARAHPERQHRQRSAAAQARRVRRDSPDVPDQADRRSQLRPRRAAASGEHSGARMEARIFAGQQLPDRTFETVAQRPRGSPVALCRLAARCGLA